MENANGQPTQSAAGIERGFELAPATHPWELRMNERFHSRWSNLALAVQVYTLSMRGIECSIVHQESRVEFLLPEQLFDARKLARDLGGECE